MQNENQQSLDDWVSSQSKSLADYVFKKGLLKKQIRIESRWTVPFQILIAQAWPAKDPEKRYWLITGSAMPTDHADGNIAQSPREAARYFALRWQLQGARVKTADNDKPKENSPNRIDWTKIGDTVAERAEILYALVQNEQNWVT